MHVTGLILSCLLLCQVSDSAAPTGPIARPQSPLMSGETAPSPSPAAEEGGVRQTIESPPTTEQIPPGEPLVIEDAGTAVFAEVGQRSVTLPEMLDQAATLPAGSKLTGRGVTLLQALSAVRGHQKQLDVTHGYWRLAASLAVYHFGFQQVERMRQLQVRPGDEMILRTALASATAALREAELSVVAAQHQLAEASLFPATAPLPLPADQPHVGTYHTHFQELFSTRTAPLKTRLISRTLPIRREAIDARAAAVRAAEEALTAAEESYQVGQGDLQAVLSCTAHLARQQRELIGLVEAYNHDIVDYAVAATGVPTSGPALVAMLIKPKHAAGQAILPKPDQAVPKRTTNPLPASGAKEPTVARPQDQQPPKTEGEPTLAPPPEETKPVESPMSERPVVPVPAVPSKPTPRTADKPPADAQGALPAVQPSLYPALVTATPPVRAKQLALALHWDRDLPEEPGRPIELVDCLRAEGGGDRQATIHAYWLARQRAAEYQVLALESEWLESLVPMASGEQFGHSGSGSVLRLRAASLGSKADRLAAHVALVESQFELTRRAAQPLDSAWLLPTTAPHSGPYELKLDAQPDEVAQSWSMRRLAAMIPTLAKSVQDHATAVVEADTARATVTGGFQTGTQSIGCLLDRTARQTDRTLAFLQSLTDYNMAIAEYALAVLPQNVSSDKLVETLVVVQ